MSESIEEKWMKNLPFDGKTENWELWEEKFLGRAFDRGYDNILDGSLRIPRESEIIPSDTKGDLQQTGLQMNKKAYADLVGCMMNTKEAKVAFRLIKNTKTSEYPRGNACLLYTSPSPRDGATSRMPSSA